MTNPVNSITLTTGPTEPESSLAETPICGVATHSAKEGEAVSLMSAGTLIIPIEDSSWRNHFETHILAAQELGIEIPNNLVIHSAQTFWENGKIQESRILGYAPISEPDNLGGVDVVAWSTPTAPQFTRGAQGELVLASEDSGRTHMSTLVILDEEKPEKYFLVITLDLIENKRISDAMVAKAQQASSRSILPKFLPQPTFIEAHRVSYGISDAPQLRNWKPVEGLLATIHNPALGAKTGYEIKFEPQKLLLDCWGFTPTLEALENELKKRDFDDVVLFYVVLSALLHTDKARWTASIDDIIKLVGRDADARRSIASREGLRNKIWRSLVVFDSWALIGARKAGVWREPAVAGEKPKKIDSQKLQSYDPLIRIVGTTRTETQQLSFDSSSAPKQVTIVPGEWLMQFHGDRKLLSEMGNIIQIAKISRGTPSGAWAACAGLMLNQLWRENASRATKVRNSRGKEGKTEVLNFRAFTRRELLAKTVRSGYDVDTILNDPKSAHRAREYWNAAIKRLQAMGVVGHYKELKEANSNDWREAWLDQPLIIRPKEETLEDALKINTDAQVARKRGRPRAIKAESPGKVG